MIEIKNVSKQVMKKHLLSDIDLILPDAGCVAFVGPNGCGKTVLLQIICGYMKPSSGMVLIDGHSYNRKIEFIQDAGIIINSPDFIPSFSVRDNLIEIAKIQNRDGTVDKIDSLLEVLELSSKQNTKYRNCSLGMKQKMRVIQAVMENHKYYIFDEPTNALDKKSINTIRSLINYLKKKSLVILTSHNEVDIDVVADVIYEMSDGSIVNVKNRAAKKEE